MKEEQFKYRGFTLIETLLVLLVTLIFISLPIFYFNSWQSYCEKALFYSQFEHFYQRAQQGAIIERRQSDINCDKREGRICFSYYQHGQKQSKILKLPKTITMLNEPKLHLVGGTGGNAGQLNNFCFREERTKVEVTYSCQMGNAKIIKHVK